MYLWRSLRGKVPEATRGSITFDTATGEILGAATWGPTSGGLHVAAVCSKLHEGCGQDYLAMLQDTPHAHKSTHTHTARLSHLRKGLQGSHCRGTEAVERVSWLGFRVCGKSKFWVLQLGFRICGKGLQGPIVTAQWLRKGFRGICSSAFAFAERAYRVPQTRHNGCGKGFWGICSSAFASAERASLGVGWGGIWHGRGASAGPCCP